MTHRFPVKLLVLFLAFTVFLSGNGEALGALPSAEDPPTTGRPIPDASYPVWDGETGMGEEIDPLYRKLVLDIATMSEEPEVRAAAQAALAAGTTDAIWDFLDTGEVEAQQRAQARRDETARQNRVAVLDLRNTGGPIFNAEVERVLAGSDSDRAAFLDYGRGIATDRDQRAQQAGQARAADLRARVTALAGAGGPAVQQGAKTALAAGDAAIAAFLNGGYIEAAKLDAAAREQYLKDLEERTKAAEQASDLAQRAARASQARRNLLTAHGHGIRALQAASDALVLASNAARQGAQILAANTASGHHSPGSFALVRQEVTRQLGLAGDSAQQARSAAAAATTEANILVEVGLPYGADWARMATGMADAAQAGVTAIQTAQHALDATVAADAAVGSAGEAAARAEDARQWRLHAEENARAAAALATAAQKQAAAAADAVTRAVQARDAAFGTKEEARAGEARTRTALETAEREQSLAHDSRLEAERKRNDAAAARQIADEKAAQARAARGEAEAQERLARDYRDRARTQEGIAATAEATALREEKKASDARDRAWAAKQQADALEARAEALEASAAADNATNQETPAWAAAHEARADANGAADAARTAHDAADRATGFAAQSREAATEATDAAAQSRAAADQAAAHAANADAAATAAESAAADTHTATMKTYALAATATAAEAEAAQSALQATRDAEQAQEQARLAAVATVRAGADAKAASDEAVSAATQAGLAARSALAARQTAAATTDRANTAITVLAPFTNADLDADFAAEVAAQAASVGAAQAQAAQDRANQAQAAANAAQQSADQAAADVKAAFQAAANAAKEAHHAAQSAADAQHSAMDAASAASIARGYADEANNYDHYAHQDAVQARQAANEANQDAAIAGLAADDAEAQAAAARGSADQAERDATIAHAAADKADRDAAEAATAAENARTHAQNTSDAAARARDDAKDAQRAADEAEKEQRQREERHRALQNAIASGCLPDLTIEDADLLNSDPEGQAALHEYLSAAADCVNGTDVADFLLEAGAEVLLEFIGVNDLKRCLGEGDIASCLWTVVNVVGLVLPFIKGKAIYKAIAAVVANIGKWIAKSELISKIAAKVLSILTRLHKFCGWFSLIGGLAEDAASSAGDTAPSSRSSVSSSAQTKSDIGDEFACGVVDYDSDQLSRIAMDVRQEMGLYAADRNIAVAYVEGWPGETPKIHEKFPNIVIGVSSRNGATKYHSEDDILDQLAAKGFPAPQIQALYSERAPCKRCSSRLKRELGPGAKAKISWSVPYGKNLEERRSVNEWMAELIKIAKHRRGVPNIAKQAVDLGPARQPSPGKEPLPAALPVTTISATRRY